MKEVLETLLNRYQHLSDYAETKLGVLITFNTALIFGLLSIYKDQNCFLKYVIIGIIILNLFSLFFAFSGVFPKTKNNHSSSEKITNKNYFYHKYVAQLNESEFLENLRKDYNLENENLQMEQDYSNQIVVLAQNANRKFNSFNIAINFTLASILTPLGLLIFHIYNNPN